MIRSRKKSWEEEVSEEWSSGGVMEYVEIEAPTESEEDIRGGIGTIGFRGGAVLTGRWVEIKQVKTLAM